MGLCIGNMCQTKSSPNVRETKISWTTTKKEVGVPETIIQSEVRGMGFFQEQNLRSLLRIYEDYS